MASGIEMMMRALGIDPEAIKAEMEKPIKELLGALQALNSRMETIDRRLCRIEQALDIQSNDPSPEIVETVAIVAQRRISGG